MTISTSHATQEQVNALVEIGILLSSERDRERLVAHILHSGKHLARCDAATLYLKTENDTLRFAVRSRDDDLPAVELPLRNVDGTPNEQYVSTWVAVHRQLANIANVYAETRFDLTGTRHFDAITGFRTVSLLTLPMCRRNGELVGVLQYINARDAAGNIVAFDASAVDLLSALASQAAVSLDVTKLISEQQQLIDTVVRIIAEAIDSRSPYTGGHCRRVPELAVMLAEAACAKADGPLAAFNFEDEDAWREFRIGAWLHDCGKVAVPDSVMDKSTKLDASYNRLHEIRTRFEVVLRDIEIARLQSLLAGEPPDVAQSKADAARAALQDDFAFVASCNLGGETLDDAELARLAAIGAREWQRHFDDRIGLSEDERVRIEGMAPASLPTRETLLADKPHHVVPRDRAHTPDPRYGFKMAIPDNLAHYGELHNLSVRRGTLTEEERYRINEHMIHTVTVLESLPFPAHMRRVPEYATTHHETLAGTGYPRRLTEAELSTPARIVAIADVFEALTAVDRPYKKGMVLSEALAIMARMRDDRHIDADLFALFLESGVYLDYARRFLKTEQIDAVDLSRYLAPGATR